MAINSKRFMEPSVVFHPGFPAGKKYPKIYPYERLAAPFSPQNADF
jgi:hypothetical protein